MKIPLFDNYSLRSSENEQEFNDFLTEHSPAMYPNTIDMNLANMLSEKEKVEIGRLYKNLGEPYRLNLYILCGEEKIGWCFGAQTDFETFNMTNTAIFKGHRNKGIYKALLPAIIKIIKEQGFQKICSRHAATNNQVLIPKLREGFTISGFEISDMFGLLIWLTYYFNETRRKVVDFRVGEAQPDAEIAKAVSLKIK